MLFIEISNASVHFLYFLPDFKSSLAFNLYKQVCILVQFAWFGLVLNWCKNVCTISPVTGPGTVTVYICLCDL